MSYKILIDLGATQDVNDARVAKLFSLRPNFRLWHFAVALIAVLGVRFRG
jgi:hypothetical protein